MKTLVIAAAAIVGLGFSVAQAAPAVDAMTEAATNHNFGAKASAGRMSDTMAKTQLSAVWTFGAGLNGGGG